MLKGMATSCFRRDNWHCRHCNNTAGLDPHHVIYKGAGGRDELTNLLTLCRKCHDDIHGGRLVIEVIELKRADLEVKFWKQKGWKP
jgi:hypothetical protein